MRDIVRGKGKRKQKKKKEDGTHPIFMCLFSGLGSGLNIFSQLSEARAELRGVTRFPVCPVELGSHSIDGLLIRFNLK